MEVCPDWWPGPVGLPSHTDSWRPFCCREALTLPLLSMSYHVRYGNNQTASFSPIPAPREAGVEPLPHGELCGF